MSELNTSRPRPRRYVKIPPERLGAVIGEHGSVIKKIMSKLGVAISIDTENSVAVIEGETPEVSADKVMKAEEIVKAIAYGFPSEKAMTLLNDDYVLVV
ncbi:MAG: KH domain-containing protein, partial [Acidilobaceae archaeon]